MTKYELSAFGRKVLIVSLFIAIAFLIGLLIGNVFIDGRITGNAVSSNQFDKNYTWTSAICDGNKCLDVLIECENGSVKGLTPISGFVEFDDEWQDKRAENRDYCE